MTSPYLSKNRRQPLTNTGAASSATAANPTGQSPRQPRIGSRARYRALDWKPRLSERPASALEARLADAFRLLDPRSAPLVSMLYAGSRPPRRIRATRVTGRRRP